MNETCKSSLHSANVGVCTEGGLRFDAGAAAPPEPRLGEPLQGHDGPEPYPVSDYRGNRAERRFGDRPRAQAVQRPRRCERIF